MKKYITLSIRIPILVKYKLSQYAKNHSISKSQFLRNIIIEKLQDLEDSNYINEVVKNKARTYTHTEVLDELAL